MRVMRKIKCKFCRWFTYPEKGKYGSSRVSHWDRLRCHVENSHKEEFKKLQIWLDSVTSTPV